MDDDNMRVLGFLFEPVRDRGTISYLNDILENKLVPVRNKCNQSINIFLL